MCNSITSSGGKNTRGDHLYMGVKVRAGGSCASVWLQDTSQIFFIFLSNLLSNRSRSVRFQCPPRLPKVGSPAQNYWPDMKSERQPTLISVWAVFPGEILALLRFSF